MRRTLLGGAVGTLARDEQGVDANGEVLDKVCEDCHITNWHLLDK
jgi:hypothetical protein